MAQLDLIKETELIILTFKKKFILFIYFWLRWVFVAARAFSSCGEGATLHCGAQTSHCGGFFCVEHGL